MATPREIDKARDGLKRVIEDLQNEHTRFTNRLTALKNKGPDDGFETVARHNIQMAYVEAKLEYLELLIRRYRSWLHV